MKTRLSFPILLCALLFVISVNSYAQVPNWQWARGIGGIDYDVPWSIAVDPINTGNIFTTGYFRGTVEFGTGSNSKVLTANEFGSTFITHHDNKGNLIWAGAFKGNETSSGTKIEIDPNGNGDIYSIGEFRGIIDFDPNEDTFNIASEVTALYISKLNRLGEFIWAKAIPGIDGELYPGGSLALDPSGNGNLYISGNFTRTIDMDPSLEVFNLENPGYQAIFISKFDVSGNFLWARAIGVSPGYIVSKSIATDPTGNGSVYITGFFIGTIDFDPGPQVFNLTSSGNRDIFICKLDSEGNFLWAKSTNGRTEGSRIASTSIIVDPSGNGAVFTTGDFYGTIDFDPSEGVFNLSGSGIFISKLDLNGNFIWAKALNGTNGYYLCNSIAIDPKGNGDVYITGGFQGTVDFDPSSKSLPISSVGFTDLFISKLDSSGGFLWVKTNAGTPPTKLCIGQSIAADQSGAVYLTGVFNSTYLTFNSTTLTNADPDIENDGKPYDVFIAKLVANKPADIPDGEIDQVSFYPNPVNDKLIIDLNLDKLSSVNIRIFNLMGEVVHSLSKNDIANKITVDISYLKSGVYFVEIDIDGNKYVNKVIKE